MSDKKFIFLKKQAVDIISLKFIVLVLIIAQVGMVAYLYVNSQNQISKLTDTVIVIDPTTGRAAVGERTYARDPLIRKWEYEDQVNNLYQSLFAFDLNNYDANIDRGLRLLDTKSAQFIYSEYNEGGVERRVKEDLWQFSVYVDSVLIDNSVSPALGVCYARQQIRRKNGAALTRNVFSRFNFQDVSKSRQNVHGVIITDLDIFNQQTVLR